MYGLHTVMDTLQTNCVFVYVASLYVIVAQSADNYCTSYKLRALNRGVATGGYIGIYTPQNQSTQNNLCGYSSAVIQDR